MLFLFIAFQIIALLDLSSSNFTNNTEEHFKKSKDYLREQEIRKNITANWTSCEEFLTNATFDINRVVDIDWQIFYFWNYEDEKSYNMRFSLATPLLVDRFKVELKDMDVNVNWSNAVLFMESSIDFSALYITTEVPGKFRLIPAFAFQMERVPMMIFGLKIVEPGYLGIMNCKQRLCYALAPVEQMPENKDITLAAEKIGFRGDHNRSYLFEYETISVPEDERAEDDADEDEAFEIENEIDEL